MAEILSKSNIFSPSSSTHLLKTSVSSKNSSFLKLRPFNSSSNSDFYGSKIVFQIDEKKPRRGSLQALPIQMSLCIGKAQRWWEKGLQSNMREITSTQNLVDSLYKAGDKLVIVDFFSPGCGGCKALHSKICQFAEKNPEVQFLQVNQEDLKSMCYSLGVHVLPFFRFYRGAHGRLCSFSCTIATIKKFKDALAKHTTERCSLSPPKGMEESELLALAANRDLNFSYTPNPAAQPVFVSAQEDWTAAVPTNLKLSLPATSKPINDFEGKTLVNSTGK